MNKRQRNKNLFIRDKRNSYFGLKKGTYMFWNDGNLPKGVEQIRLHHEIFTGEGLENFKNKKNYLCKKNVLGWENWWLATSTDIYKVIQVTEQHLQHLKEVVENSHDGNIEQKNLLLILSKCINK